MSETLPCPRCDKPIADTAYVCAVCARKLADDLREAVALWVNLQETVGRATRTTGRPQAGGHKVTRHGPTCRGMTCDHESCEAIWKARHRALTEQPLPHEDAPLISLSAAEDSWIVTNTATTWARHISEQRGIPIPKPKPKSRHQNDVETLHVITDDEKPKRCIYSDLFTEHCACGHTHQESA